MSYIHGVVPNILAGKYIKERKVRHDTRKDEIEKLKRERESLKMELK